MEWNGRDWVDCTKKSEWEMGDDGGQLGAEVTEVG